MTQFSRRYGYSPKTTSDPILEDAPSWIRVGYIHQVLKQFTFIDNDSRYINSSGRPLGIKNLNETLCVAFQEDIDSNATDSWFCEDFLHDLVKRCEWYEFYDIIEIVAQEVKSVEEHWRIANNSWANTYTEQIEKYGLQSYCRLVNELFASNNVAWRIDIQGILKRDLPEALGRRVEATHQELIDEFEPAREHYRKAVRFANTRPIDPENSIKEIVSAVESVGKILYPSSSTLGDVVKEMRREQVFPTHLSTVIEKFYAYASSEPAVRHGATVPSKVLLDDAEFCLHLGAALIRYLMAYSKRNIQNKTINI